jgi:tetratricopeptide (TPR) repeat protein
MDDPERAPVPLFGDVDEPSLRPERSVARCRHCHHSLREEARFCERCGADAVTGEPRPATRSPAVALWLAVVALIVALVGWRVLALSTEVARRDAESALREAELDRKVARLEEKVTAASKVVYLDRGSPERRPAIETEAVTTPAASSAVVLPPIDESALSLRERFGRGVLLAIARDENGADLDVAPAFAATPQRVITTWSLLEGAASVVIAGNDGGERTVTGIVTRDVAYDLALLEIAEPGDLEPLVPAGSPFAAPLAATVLGPASRTDWREATIELKPGARDEISGAPRLAIGGALRHAGVALDEDGAVLALIVDPETPALATWFAAAWLAAPAPASPLDAFLRAAGPGTPQARMKRARQLLAEQRLVEAVRLILTLTAEEPRLLPEIGAELALAALEVARDAITRGAPAEADALLSEVLVRLPDDADLWATRGRALALGGRVESAIECLATAATKDAKRRDALLAEALGLLLDAASSRAAEGLAGDAIALLSAQRRRFTESAALRELLGDLLLRERRFEEASRMYAEGAAVEPAVAPRLRPKAERARELAGGPGAIVIDYPPGDSRVVVVARLNGQSTARLLLDGGDPNTVLPSAAVAAAGYSLPSLPRVRFAADPEQREVPALTMSSISIAGVAAARVPVLVFDGYAVPDAEGVLGQSFLARFRRVEDVELGRLVLYPR